MNQTRKHHRGGGLFDLLTGKTVNAPAVTESSLKAKRNYNMRHSKSRVANYTTGNFKYTNKGRIEGEYQKALAELKKIEKNTWVKNQWPLVYFIQRYFLVYEKYYQKVKQLFF
jgi:hypothetical protein